MEKFHVLLGIRGPEEKEIQWSMAKPVDSSSPHSGTYSQASNDADARLREK